MESRQRQPMLLVDEMRRSVGECHCGKINQAHLKHLRGEQKAIMICVRDNLDKRPCPKLTSYTYIVMLCLSIIICLDVISLCDGQKPINLGGVKRRDVYIAGFFPYGRHVPESHVGRGVMPSVKLAVDHINDNPTILRNYRLHMWWNDTEDLREALMTNEMWNENAFTSIREGSCGRFAL
ncbi:hypothetical protein PV325_000941 [Microctonus aethiopoides]|nr:hypothetical protein PV325_000941 [Microctonus aethiopoides]